MMMSCLWVAKTRAGLTFVKVRSEKGKWTSQISPGLGFGTVDVLFRVVPLLEAAFGDLRHLSRVEPFLDVGEQGEEVLRRQLKDKLFNLFNAGLGFGAGHIVSLVGWLQMALLHFIWV